MKYFISILSLSVLSANAFSSSRVGIGLSYVIVPVAQFDISAGVGTTSLFVKEEITGLIQYTEDKDITVAGPKVSLGISIRLP